MKSLIIARNLSWVLTHAIRIIIIAYISKCYAAKQIVNPTRLSAGTLFFEGACPIIKWGVTLTKFSAFAGPWPVYVARALFGSYRYARK